MHWENMVLRENFKPVLRLAIQIGRAYKLLGPFDLNPCKNSPHRKPGLWRRVTNKDWWIALFACWN